MKDSGGRVSAYRLFQAHISSINQKSKLKTPAPIIIFPITSFQPSVSLWCDSFNDSE